MPIQSSLCLVSQRFCRSILPSIGVGFALALSLPQAKAFVTVNRGTDYVRTPPAKASVMLPLGPGGAPIEVFFSGLPIGTPTPTPPDGGIFGEADTVINRLNDVTVAGGLTNLEIVGLSLRADDYPNVYVGLQTYGTSGTLSTGTMTIDEATWSSSFTINGVAVIAPNGTAPSGTDFVKNLIQTKCGTSGFQCIDFVKGPFSAFGEPYSRTPLINQLLGANLVQPGLQSDFYITLPVLHVAPDGIHGIDPTVVPGPLPILGASTAYAFARRLRKRTRLASTAS